MGLALRVPLGPVITKDSCLVVLLDSVAMVMGELQDPEPARCIRYTVFPLWYATEIMGPSGAGEKGNSMKQM